MEAYERFLKYVSFPTMSDENSEDCPSTAKQLALADYLVQELQELGLEDIRRDEHGYVYAALPANCDADIPTVGFIAHLDTSSEAEDYPIKPQIVDYQGGDIVLNEKQGIVMRLADYPHIAKFAGQHLIVTDGTTLLGADDKAGIAAIVAAVARIKDSDRPHGRIMVGFNPDEEIGRGADLFDVEGFGCDFGYTLDGGALGDLNYENFNGARGVAEFIGFPIHTGSAKGKMKNAALYAAEFVSLFPEDEIPAATEGYEGFYHLLGISGTSDHAKVDYLLRDHDRAKYEARKAFFEECGRRINEKYGEGTCIVTVTDTYFNMRQVIEDGNMHVVDRAIAAMRQAGVEPIVTPIRGGTDGATLSYKGLPCPNIFTGGGNFHSRFEFLSIEGLNKAVEVVENIVYGLTAKTSEN